MNVTAQDVMGLIGIGAPSAAALKTLLAPVAERGGRVHVPSIVTYAVLTPFEEHELDALFDLARDGYDNALEGSEMAEDWAAIGTFFAHWSVDPPGEQMSDADGARYDQDSRCIGIFHNPKVSCAVGDMHGMYLWPHFHDDGHGSPTVYDGPNSRIGWGFAAFRMLIPFDGSFPQARYAPSPYGAKP